MTRQRYIGVAAATAALGGAAWVTKVAVLAATDGEEGFVPSFLFVSGILLMLLGASWVGVRLAGARPTWVAIVLGALTPLLVLVSFALIDPVAKAAIADGWFDDEAAILLTGLLWLAASVPAWLGTTSPAPSARSTT